MRSVLTIEEFNKIKKQMISMMEEWDELMKKEEKNPGFDDKKFMENFYSKYHILQDYLLSFDLSEIPFENWKDVFLHSNNGNVLDFSKTRANIDFGIIDFDGFGNFKGCNVKNIVKLFFDIREEYFDKKTIENNMHIFLSNNFSEEFKKKYYSSRLSIEDFDKLSHIQLLELKKKENMYLRLPQDQRVLFNYLGFDTVIKFYKEHREDYNYLIKLLDVPLFYFDDDLITKLKQVDISEIKSTCLEFVRNRYLNYWGTIEIDKIPDFFIKENNDIFLTDIDLPSDLRERFYKRKITINDIINNPNIFENIPIENFRVGLEDRHIIKYAIDIVGKENLKKVIFNYFDVLKYLYENSRFHSFDNKFILESESFEEGFLKAVKAYFIKENEYEFSNFSKLPDWISSMNFKLVTKYDSIEELYTYNASCIVMDKYQSNLLNSFNIETIKKLIENIGLFINIYNLDNFCYFFYQIKKERIVGNTYEELINVVATFLRQNIYGINYDSIKGEFRDKYSNIFIDENAPKELKNKFYSGKLTITNIVNNPDYLKYISRTDIDVLFKNILINISGEDKKGENIVKYIKRLYGNENGFSILLGYGKYIEAAYNGNLTIEMSGDNTKEELIAELENIIYKGILEKGIMYDENIPKHFKDKYPYLFLPLDTPKEIKEWFYNRKFKIKDFYDNPDLLRYFVNTDIACGLATNCSWCIGLLNTRNDLSKKMKILAEYEKIKDSLLANCYKDYMIKNIKNISIDKIDKISEVLFRLSVSNSSELFNFKDAIANQLLDLEDPISSLNRIEDIFLKNNLPIVGKLYSVFQILHPNCDGFDFSDYNNKISPILKNSTVQNRNIIIFSDLLKASFGSNNRSIADYLKNIEEGNILFNKITVGELNASKITGENKKILEIFIAHLNTLYNNTKEGKEKPRKLIGDIEKDLSELLPLFKTSERYNLPDRIIRMFGFFAGFKSFEQAKQYFHQKTKLADKKNRDFSRTEITLEQGDFIKGLGDIKYLHNILQNGSVSKEFLGGSAGSDATPLDTDLSIVVETKQSIAKTIESTEAAGYGPIWIVLKQNDTKFIITRRSPAEEIQEVSDITDLNKIEAFYTGVTGKGHFGIRTGFASSDIDYFVTNGYNESVGLEITMNGFYIPVVDKNTGKVIFTPEDYDALRSKMSGLSYYGENNYIFSDNLINEDTTLIAEQIEQSNIETRRKRDLINSIIKESLLELGLVFKDRIDGDLSEGVVELIDTGSTGRCTNKPGEGDFDFMMRLDKSILTSPSQIDKLKKNILKKLGKENSFELTGTGDFRLKEVKIDDKTSVDIDITFTGKTDKVSYSTDMCLQERLSNIYSQNPRKYNYVVANILLAKQVLKEGNVYKPNRGENPQGGLGGVGIENWILQHGGSFIDAAKSFLAAAEERTFEEFKNIYYIWDFGENHMSEIRGQYSHDNFVSNNMSQFGYNRMIVVLKEYVKKYEYNQSDTKKR